MRIISFILFFGLFFSCCSTSKNKVGTEYTSGTITMSENENDCAYTIKVHNNEKDIYYDPINLETKYMKGGLKVQFQYRVLRMKNRCDKANPISITEISKL